MKVAVLSDIHGNGIALYHTIMDLEHLGISKVIILGDVVMKGPMPSYVLELLNNKNLEILAWIKGNTEMWFKEMPNDWTPSSNIDKAPYLYYKYAKANLKEDQISFLSKLPSEYSLTVNGITVLCVHGTPKSIFEAIDGSVSEDEIKVAISGVKEQVILSGHSHTSFIGEVNGKKIFNVGSIGNSLDQDNRISYGILDFSKDNLKLLNRRINYPVHKIIDIALENKFPYLNEYKNIILSASMS
ncbi:metallophosphoesterase family protein [Clostridium uliginosum]|uniref:Phosphoesterase, MJ0936 family n=1 Tax=Clostridium uliginosum TaxID=119641 RepID=A0A1I1NNV8_9CLOT|nr:metallophosphoesterase family protein [Clostridium uliginosum]SFC99096.1 phosphoesterase, MJ0936 family [Clostridium uliginosum]